MGGLELECTADTIIAVCGADLGVALDGNPLPLWESVRIRPGQQLAFAQPVNGLRAYLAIAGGFAAEPVLGSTACVPREASVAWMGSVTSWKRATDWKPRRRRPCRMPVLVRR